MFWLHVQVITVVKLKCWKVESLENGVEWTLGTVKFIFILFQSIRKRGYASTENSSNYVLILRKIFYFHPLRVKII